MSIVNLFVNTLCLAELKYMFLFFKKEEIEKSEKQLVCPILTPKVVKCMLECKRNGGQEK